MAHLMTCIVTLSGIVRQLKTLLEEENDSINGINLYTCKEIMCLFQVKARRKSHTPIYRQARMLVEYIGNYQYG